MKAALVIPSMDPALLGLCLRWHDRCSPGVARVVVETGGRTDTYGAWCHEGANLAREEGADLLVFANDDAFPMPGWLDTMREDIQAVKDAGYRPGLIGACSNAISGPQACIGNGGRRKNGPAVTVKHIGTVYTFFAAIETAAYFDSGGFDLDLPAHCGADDALSVRLVRAGHSNWRSRAFAAHMGSETFVRAGVDREADQRAAVEYLDATYPEWGRLSTAEPRKVTA